VKFAAGFLAALVLIGASVSPRVSRNNLAAMELMSDNKLKALEVSEPGSLLGATRGVYLEGYGAVFTTELDLLAFAAPNPFRPAYNAAQLNQLKIRKKGRINIMKQRMQESLVIMAQQLEGVPASEQIALAVTVPYWPWEEASGMPKQILMQATKSALLNPATLNTSLRVQEF
jgi:hypothetical protein